MSASQFTDLRGKEFERRDMTGAPFTTVSHNEEWWHRMFAERDLAVLEERD